MIFGRAIVGKVLSGEKTETRRPLKPGQLVSQYRAGRDYAIQDKRGGFALARMYVHAVVQEKLGDLTEEGAVREGFASVADFVAYWRLLYGHHDPELPVVVVTFTVIRPCALCARPTMHVWTVPPLEDKVYACDEFHLKDWLSAAEAREE